MVPKLSRERLLLPKTISDPVVPEPPVPEAQKPLPCWRQLPLDAKFPVTPAPKGDVTFVTTRVCEPAYKSRQRVTFDLTDPHNRTIRTDYNALTDPNLKSWITRPTTQKQIRTQNLITDQGRVPCNVRDFNDYRKYVRHQAVLAARAEKDNQLEYAADRRKKKIQETKAKAELMSAEVKYKVLRAQHKARQMEEEKKLRLEVKQTLDTERQREWEQMEDVRKKKKLLERKLKWEEKLTEVRRVEEMKRRDSAFRLKNLEEESAKFVSRHAASKEKHAEMIEAKKREQWDRKKSYQERLLQLAQDRRHQAEEHIRSLKDSDDDGDTYLTNISEKSWRLSKNISSFLKKDIDQFSDQPKTEGNSFNSLKSRDDLEVGLMLPRSQSVRDASGWVMEEVLHRLGMHREAGKLADNICVSQQRLNILDSALGKVTDRLANTSPLSTDQEELSKILHLMIRKVLRDLDLREKLPENVYRLFSEFRDVDVSVKAEHLSRIQMKTLMTDLYSKQGDDESLEENYSQRKDEADDFTLVSTSMKHNIEDIIGVERDLREFLDVLQQEPMKADELRSVIGVSLKLAAQKEIDEKVKASASSNLQNKVNDRKGGPKSCVSSPNKNQNRNFKEKGIHSDEQLSSPTSFSSSEQSNSSDDRKSRRRKRGRISSRSSRSFVSRSSISRSRSRSPSYCDEDENSVNKNDNLGNDVDRQYDITDSYKKKSRIKTAHVGQNLSCESLHDCNSLKQPANTEDDVSDRSISSGFDSDSISENETVIASSEGASVKTLSKRLLTKIQERSKPTDYVFPPVRLHRFIALSVSRLWRATNSPGDDVVFDSIDGENFIANLESLLLNIRRKLFSGKLIRILKNCIVKCLTRGQMDDFRYDLPEGITQAILFRFRNDLEKDYLSPCRVINVMKSLVKEYETFKSNDVNFRVDLFCMELLTYCASIKTDKNILSTKGEDIGDKSFKVTNKNDINKILASFQMGLIDSKERSLISEIIAAMGSSIIDFKEHSVTRVIERIRQRNKTLDNFKTTSYMKLCQDLTDILLPKLNQCDPLFILPFPGNDIIPQMKGLDLCNALCFALFNDIIRCNEDDVLSSYFLSRFAENLVALLTFRSFDKPLNDIKEFWDEIRVHHFCIKHGSTSQIPSILCCAIKAKAVNAPSKQNKRASPRLSKERKKCLTLLLHEVIVGFFRNVSQKVSETYGIDLDNEKLWLVHTDLMRECYEKLSSYDGLCCSNEMDVFVKFIIDSGNKILSTKLEAKRKSGISADNYSKELVCAILKRISHFGYTPESNSRLKNLKFDFKTKGDVKEKTSKRNHASKIDETWENLVVETLRQELVSASGNVCSRVVKSCPVSSSKDLSVTLAILCRLANSFLKRLSDLQEVITTQKFDNSAIINFFNSSQLGKSKPIEIEHGVHENIVKCVSILTSQFEKNLQSLNLLNELTQSILCSDYHNMDSYCTYVFSNISAWTLAEMVKALLKFVWESFCRVSDCFKENEFIKSDSRESSKKVETMMKKGRPLAEETMRKFLNSLSRSIEIEFNCHGVWDYADNDENESQLSCSSKFANTILSQLVVISEQMIDSQNSDETYSQQGSTKTGSVQEEPNDTRSRDCMSFGNIIPYVQDILARIFYNVSCMCDVGEFPSIHISKLLKHFSGNVNMQVNENSQHFLIQKSGEKHVSPVEVLDRICCKDTSSWFLAHISKTLENLAENIKVQVGAALSVNDVYDAKLRGAACLDTLSEKVKSDIKRGKVVVVASSKLALRYRNSLKSASKGEIYGCFSVYEYFKQILSKTGVMAGTLAKEKRQFSDAITDVCNVIILSNFGFPTKLYKEYKKRITDSCATKYLVLEIVKLALRDMLDPYKPKKPCKTSQSEFWPMYLQTSYLQDSNTYTPSKTKCYTDPYKADVLTRQKLISKLKKSNPYYHKSQLNFKPSERLNSKTELDRDHTETTVSTENNNMSKRCSGSSQSKDRSCKEIDKTKKRLNNPELEKSEKRNRPLRPFSKEKGLNLNKEKRNVGDFSNRDKVDEEYSDNDTLGDLSKNDTLDDANEGGKIEENSDGKGNTEPLDVVDSKEEKSADSKLISDKTKLKSKTNKATRLRMKNRTNKYDFFPPDEFYKSKELNDNPKIKDKENDDVFIDDFKYDSDTISADVREPERCDKNVAPIILKLLERELPLETFILQKCLNENDINTLNPSKLLDYVATIDHLWSKRESEYKDRLDFARSNNDKDCSVSLSEGRSEAETLSELKDIQTSCGSVSLRTAGAVHNLLRSVNTGSIWDTELLPLVQDSELRKKRRFEVGQSKDLSQEVASGLLSMIERVEQGIFVPDLLLEKPNKLAEAMESTTHELKLHNEKVLDSSDNSQETSNDKTTSVKECIETQGELDIGYVLSEVSFQHGQDTSPPQSVRAVSPSASSSWSSGASPNRVSPLKLAIDSRNKEHRPENADSCSESSLFGPSTHSERSTPEPSVETNNVTTSSKPDETESSDIYWKDEYYDD